MSSFHLIQASSTPRYWFAVQTSVKSVATSAAAYYQHSQPQAAMV